MKESPAGEILYRYRNGLYVNLTNRCPTACSFCVKRTWGMKYRGYDLNLKGSEPEAGEVMELINGQWSKEQFSEIVFCGYGEPTLRLSELLKICRSVKKESLQPAPPARLADVSLRLNTIGLGSLVWGRDITPELKGNIDSVHVSLNTADPAQWLEIMRPENSLRENGFESVLAFIASCAGLIPETVVTAVENPEVDLEACARLAEKLGASFRPRPLLEQEQCQ